ncbi:longevity assurance proteins LAG1/LAC1 [Mycena maculata]|uniref:Longevity assurance proteins LAG1/LAC1 n=1 Tax=Mycena maculata TaxID=230809 RepID=A0AAD7HH24_9AGAR|nr:longevity assurance proteins LAG1/LAC1 [Mycena maculata]
MDDPSRTRRKSEPPHLTKETVSGPTHHFSDSFEPQTPLGMQTPVRTGFPGEGRHQPSVSPGLRWAVEPVEALPILVVPIVLSLCWELLVPHLAPLLGISGVPQENPFARFILLSHRVPGPEPRYARGPGDVAFVAYYVVFFSLARQLITVALGRRVGRFFGIVRTGKLERFGEQGYAFVYFLVFGAWGVHIMSELPTWWYRTKFFWIDYPHTAMIPSLKRYYLMQTAYWVQQFLVLVLGLEKPRKDYAELVAHHVVTLWLVVFSYITNFTLIGSAVYTSMDIPDMLLALSKLLNYIQWNGTNNFVLAAFVVAWTYFRHYLNLAILWSVWFEVDAYLPANVVIPLYQRYTAFTALSLLQLLNLFWYYLIVRIAVRAMVTAKAEDVRSDDEDEEGDGDGDDGGSKSVNAGHSYDGEGRNEGYYGRSEKSGMAGQ